MLGLLAALALSPVNPAAGIALADSHLPAAPWWERITVSFSGDGQSKSCLYTSSTSQKSSDCAGDTAATAASSSAEHSAGDGGQVTRVTFERRFTPGALTAEDAQVQPGDTLIGREVMALNIDGRGSVRGCKVVATSGDTMLDYGCAEARAERFEAAARRDVPAQRLGYMSVLVYAHPEHIA
jgi:hypothetical protein